MNSGIGASTVGRKQGAMAPHSLLLIPSLVRWPGFHVLNDSREASPFTVQNFIQGELWIPATGVPFWPEI
ncbi:hypothetical protein ACSBR2_016893 [Camellia fascicularis]